jgi:protein-disulfide isomerase
MRSRQRVGCAVVSGLLAVASWVGPAPAQSAGDLDALRRELEALKEGQAAILKEVQDLRTLILGAARSARGPRADAVVSVEGARFLGDPRAPVTVVEFSDYQCPFCARHVHDTMPQIERELVKTGRVKYVVLDFPITGLHPDAFRGHEAARCAGEQGKFWPMHARLFDNRQSMQAADLEAHAQALGLDRAAFRQCLASGRHGDAIRRNLEEGQKAGITGTPTFLFGLTDPKEPRVRVTRTLTGAQPYDRFKETIDSLLRASD